MINTTIRRKDRALSHDNALKILDAAEHGVLSLVDVDGVPYGIPLDFVRDGDTIIMHGSTEGRKIDCLRHESRVSFCVIGCAEPIREKFTSRYESVIVSGQVELVDDDARKMELLLKLCERFAPKNAPNHRNTSKAFAEKHLKQTLLILLHSETITGKANRML